METVQLEAGRGCDWVGWGYGGRRLTCQIRRVDAADANRGMVAVWDHAAAAEPEEGELVASGMIAGLAVPGFESAAAVYVLVDVATRAGWPDAVIEAAAAETGGGVA